MAAAEKEAITAPVFPTPCEHLEGSEMKANEEPILPDSYWGGENGTIPIFKPTMEQFRSFPEFIKKIDHYGMKAGIVKVIPPQEWLDTLPELDDKVKGLRVQSAIEQNFAGSGGAFRQMNLEKQRTYTLPQWRKICDSSEHQPPAKRGEARRVGGRKSQPMKRKVQAPATPPPNTDSDSGSPPPRHLAKARKSKTLDDTELEDFDYRIDDNDQYTPERCLELEKSYWKSLTFNNPMYGADLPGSLFDDNTTEWNVAHLDNILNRLGVTLPGVNSAYLYLGMWKATFSWHVEDMDLYSINYIHFGAPKQWYSVSQDDNQKFEKVMKDIFPNDARHCGQFMRHKTFGASPARLAQHDLHVNKLVHYEREFVITFPYGYHSGYNLGYNCAESVNFATEEWLEYGKVARKCECVTDAVSIDVNDIIRAVNGDDNVEQDKDEMLTPPASEDGLSADPVPRATYSEFERARRTNKKKRNKDAIYEAAPVVRYKKLSEKYHARPIESPSAKPVVKKIKMSMPKAPCDLCPRTPRYEDVLDAGNGHKVHRVCAEFIPETSITTDTEGKADKEHVTGFDSIDKARLSLKCSLCRLSSGACFQCSSPKCVRAFHGTCAYDAGVLVQKKESSTGGLTYHFSCKTHRPRRAAPETLEFDPNITAYASGLQSSAIVQVQFAFGHVFSGLVRENRRSERTIVVEVGNDGEMIEVDYQWVLAVPKKAMKAALAQIHSKSESIAPTMRKEDFVNTSCNGASIESSEGEVPLPGTCIKIVPTPQEVCSRTIKSDHVPRTTPASGAFVNPYTYANLYNNPYSVAQNYYTATGVQQQSQNKMANLLPLGQPMQTLSRIDSSDISAYAQPSNSIASQQHFAIDHTSGLFIPNMLPMNAQPHTMMSMAQYQPGVPQYYKIGSSVPTKFTSMPSAGPVSAQHN